jgi:hypothetical protein
MENFLNGEKKNVSKQPRKKIKKNRAFLARSPCVVQTNHQVMQCRSGSNDDFLRRIAFILLEITVESDFLDFNFSTEMNVDNVRLRSIAPKMTRREQI